MVPSSHMPLALSNKLRLIYLCNETLASHKDMQEQLAVLNYPDFRLKFATSQKLTNVTVVRTLQHYKLLKNVSAPAQVSLLKSVLESPIFGGPCRCT